MSGQSILFICSVDNFQQYTRRATIEAIGSINAETYVGCIRSFWRKAATGMTSDAVKLIYFYYFFPRKILNTIPAINALNYYLNKLFVNTKLNTFDVVCFTFPTQSHLLPFFTRGKKVFILSDPYHLMKQKKEEEGEIIAKADVIFATAKALAEVYIPRYFGDVKAKVVYWPNCVDLSIWDRNKFAGSPKSALQNRPVKIGFAGNFMKVTDFELLDKLTDVLPDASFVLAGKVEPDLASSEKETLEKIFNKSNVNYKGLIPYQQLQSEIYSWDIGIMIDKISEIASYHHHNKFYQYLALGLPVIYQANHSDYNNHLDVAASSSNLESFIANLTHVITNLSSGKSYVDSCLGYVKNHTNSIRAKAFLDSLGTSTQVPSSNSVQPITSTTNAVR